MNQRISSLIAALACVASVAFVPAPTFATSDHDATAHRHGLVQQVAERGLVISKGNLGLGLDLRSSQGVIDGYTAALPVRFGVNDRLEIFMSPQLQTVEPTLSDPAIGATYRFRDKLFEVCGRVSFDMALFGPKKSFAGSLAAPIRVHIRENLSLDATPTLTVAFSPATDWHLSLPLAGQFNLTDAIGVMGGTLLSLQEGSAGAGGLIVGGSWTAAENGKAWLEIGGHMSWKTVGDAGLMQMILFARFYAHGVGRKKR